MTSVKSINLIYKINIIIDSFNYKQQSIAKDLIIDSNFEFSESKSLIYILDKRTKSKHNFISYVKSKCNCED
jgi:hypothetical protein